jgi:hypothetical protein
MQAHAASVTNSFDLASSLIDEVNALSYARTRAITRTKRQVCGPARLLEVDSKRYRPCACHILRVLFTSYVDLLVPIVTDTLCLHACAGIKRSLIDATHTWPHPQQRFGEC